MSDAKKILLIDDDVDFVESIKDLMEANGYEVTTAHNGDDGVAAAEKSRPDLIILDVMMRTDTEGIETSRRLKALMGARPIPVLLMTGIRKAMHLPFGLTPDDDWLPVKAVLDKPVPPQRLLAEVQKQLTA